MHSMAVHRASRQCGGLSTHCRRSSPASRVTAGADDPYVIVLSAWGGLHCITASCHVWNRLRPDPRLSSHERGVAVFGRTGHWRPVFAAATSLSRPLCIDASCVHFYARVRRRDRSRCHSAVDREARPKRPGFRRVRGSVAVASSSSVACSASWFTM